MTVTKITKDLVNGFSQSIEMIGDIVGSTDYLDTDIILPNTVNQNDRRFLYSGTWANAYDADAFYNDIFYLGDGNSGSFTFKFYGTKFYLIYTQDVDRGIITINIDGDPDANSPLDQSGAQSQQEEWVSDTYSLGTHTVLIAKSGSADVVNIDAIRVEE